MFSVLDDPGRQDVHCTHDSEPHARRMSPGQHQSSKWCGGGRYRSRLMREDKNAVAGEQAKQVEISDGILI